MTTAITRLSGSAFELTITVPWSDVKAVYDKVFEEISSEIEVEGFRKGKAPKELIQKQINKNSVYDEVIKRLLPDAYTKALTEHGLKPIVNPKVQIASGQEEKDWQFIAKAAEKPTVDLGDYKKQIAGLNAKGTIWTPGDSPADTIPTGEEPARNASHSDAGGEEKTKKLNTIIEKLLEICILELPQLLIDSEVDRLMTQLIDDIRSAGLTFEQYTTSKGTSAQGVRDNYQKQVTATLKLEFILEAVADDLRVVVDEKEIAEIINRESDAKKKEALKAQTYYLTSLLRREKTLTKLSIL